MFLGIRVPATRAIVRQHRDLPRADRLRLRLLKSKYHDERLVALLLMVDAYRRGDEKERARICRDYLAHSKYINNWDLVDSSAEHIVGPELGKTVSPSQLRRLAQSKLLWDRRIAMLATFHWIKQREFEAALEIAHILLEDDHDLIHKAVGWMLREIGKRDRAVDALFLPPALPHHAAHEAALRDRAFSGDGEKEIPGGYSLIKGMVFPSGRTMVRRNLWSAGG